MSNITEQTVIIAKEQEENFRKSYENYEDDYRLNDLKEAYRNEQIIIFIYDCNGEPPWFFEAEVPFLFLEIAFSREELCTFKGDGKGNYKDSRFHLRYHLKKIIPLEVDSVCQKIAYSMNSIYNKNPKKSII